jgi:hypothetical protein
MLGYLIDPALRRIVDIELPNNVRQQLDEMRRIIGCEYMDHARLSDRHDELWCDEWALARGLPVFAFQFKNKRGTSGPYGGRCIVTGNDDGGNPAPPAIPIEWLENDVTWLDEIVPELHQIIETPDIVHGHKMQRFRTIVTWSRPK